MPHSFGKRSRTRDLFSRPYRMHGKPAPSTYLIPYKVGDYVDVVANSAIQRGLPHKFYHGRTGRIWNITPHAVGVLVTKQVRQRTMLKKIHVRIEHVRPSRCRERVPPKYKMVKGKKVRQSTIRQPFSHKYVKLTKHDKSKVVEVLPFELLK